MFKPVVVMISKEDFSDKWALPDIPFVSYTGGYEHYPHYPRVKTRERVAYLSRRRNLANTEALRRYSDLTHFFSLDSYYIDDVKEIKALVTEYQEYDKDVILGASTWYIDPSRMKKRKLFWDTWTNPEFLNKTPDFYPIHDGLPAGWVETRGAGGFVIYPRWVWERQGYGIPEPFPESGCESNYLSRCPGAKTFITFNVRAWRDPPEELKNKPYINRIRTTLGIRTRLGLRKPASGQG